ncbi:MAG: bifunctional phosphoglucose/phosphomannose isomerase [Calditrichales bacterium]|nr:MAG: bifunctional phosphoglucose/phosphomannose isomerase [Calditrichales bacterium]
MYSVDKTNFKKYLVNFPHQIAESYKIFKQAKISLKKDKINNIICLGMGGSAIAGDILSDVLFDSLTLPLKVNRGYGIPAYCTESSLVIASSYSGNTEETLSAVEAARKKKARIVAITSGGELLSLAQKYKWPVLQIPEGFPPRQAFGYMFFTLYQLIGKMISLDISEGFFNNLVHKAETIVYRCNEETASGKVFAKDLALHIKNKIPVIYSSDPYLSAIGVRWKNQFQENSKSMAFSNVIPEMNHNEIVGWELENECLKNYLVLFIEHENIHPRINARINLTKNIIRDRSIEVMEVYAEGDTPIEHVLSLIITSDWVSYYLALYYEKDPINIVNIDYLKGELKKQS